MHTQVFTELATDEKLYYLPLENACEYSVAYILLYS